MVEISKKYSSGSSTATHCPSPDLQHADVLLSCTYCATIDMQDFRCSPQCELADCIILHLFKCSNVQCLCSTVQCQPNCCAPPPSSDRCSMNENSLLLGKLAESRISLINNCKLDRAPTWQLLSFRPRVINAKWLKST